MVDRIKGGHIKDTITKVSHPKNHPHPTDVGMVMVVTTRSQQAATKEEIPEELTFELKEPLKALSADQWREEKKLQRDMIDTIHDTQKDQVLPGPDSWNSKLSRDSLEDKGYKKTLKNQWKGLPHMDEPTRSKPGKQMDPKTSLAKIGDKIMSTTIELTIRQLLTLAPDLFEYVHNYTTEQEAPPDKEIPVQEHPIVQKATTAAIAVDRQMPVIQLQICRNLVDNVLLNGDSGVNIMFEDLRRRLGLPKPNPAPSTYEWQIQVLSNQ